LEVDRELWGIEVKASRSVDARDLRGFQPLADRTRRLKRRIVVFLGSRRQKLGDAEAMPLDSFLEVLPA
jgi:predicted AAA+ superfamily ATPase